MLSKGLKSGAPESSSTDIYAIQKELEDQTTIQNNSFVLKRSLAL
jgi:hypothetical protein